MEVDDILFGIFYILQLKICIVRLQYIDMIEKYDRLLQSIQREVQLDSFERYIIHSEEHKNQLIFNIRTTKSQGLPRFNVWRLLLDIIPFSQSWQEKIAKLEANRNRWQVLKNQSKTAPKQIGKQGPLSIPRNPLMKAAIKPEKKQAETDSFLKEEIKKDVDRTYQQLEFFQDAAILKLLTDVLFVWCKANPEISYKQGMNQLLASIVWVYFHEAVPADYQPSNETQKRYQILNSVIHAQADVYVVFEKIMDIQRQMFKQNLDSQIKGVKNPNSKINSPILLRISQLQDNKLKILDIELYRALKLQDVKTKTFLLRWIRCLHCREFGLVGSLPIWDSIFLDAYENPVSTKAKKQFQFIDAVCLSMFIYVRSVVLKLETTNEIMQVYQKYAKLQGQYLQELLGLAWSICGQLHSLQTKGNEEQHEVKTLNLTQNFYSKEKKEEKPSEPVTKNQAQQKKLENTSAEKTQVKVQQKSLQVPKMSPIKEQISPKNSQNNQILFQNGELKQILDKLIQSNTYNENVQSKNLVRWVIEKLQSKLCP